MIPSNAFTSVAIPSTFLYLNEIPYTPLTQHVMGGIALNDPSHGRLYQQWTVIYDGTNIVVNPAALSAVVTLPIPDVTSVSMAFDSNMSIVLAWTTLTDANLYYYDTITASYITRVFSGVNSCRVCVDNPEDFYNAQSDVIFGYTLNGNLCYRQQRDRYDIERIIQPTTKPLKKIGMSAIGRLQFDMYN